MASPTPLLEVSQVTKSFPGVTALSDVDLQVYPGEVLAVIGENGAGKSTLMKILAGIQGPDAGRLVWGGETVELTDVLAAMGLGIVLIHQELNLADNLDIGANIFLGREPRRFGWIDKARIREDSRQLLDQIGLDAPPDRLVKELTVGRQQMVEIAKAISVDARVLIMDEPTSSLSQHETERLFEVIQALQARGVSIVYISHRLGEVQALADRVVVLRDGKNAGQLTRDEITHDAMVALMVGRDVSQFYARQAHSPGEVLLDVRDLTMPGYAYAALSFSVRAGEIVGLAGLVGAGRTETLRCLFGIDSPLAGEVRVDGELLTPGDPWSAIRAGMALVPEDRKLHGVLVDLPVTDNISLPGLWRNRRAGAFRDGAQERQQAAEIVDRLGVKTPSLEQPLRYLSGGNQQKVALGKWLALRPKILLLDEPTRGIDIGAKHEIYQIMHELAGQGTAVLFVSSEMEEILGLSDRALVMHEGKLSGELQRDELSEEAVMQLATAANH